MAKQTTAIRSIKIIDVLERKHLGMDPIFTAITTVDNIVDILRVHDAYVLDLRQNGLTPEIRRNAEEIAYSNINTAMWQMFDAKGVKNWQLVMDALKDAKFTTNGRVKKMLRKAATS